MTVQELLDAIVECEAKELKHILGVVVRIHGEVLVSEHLVSAGKVCAECFKCMIIMSEVITELGWILTVRIIWTPNLENEYFKLSYKLQCLPTLCFLLCIVPLGSLMSSRTLSTNQRSELFNQS